MMMMKIWEGVAEKFVVVRLEKLGKVNLRKQEKLEKRENLRRGNINKIEF